MSADVVAKLVGLAADEQIDCIVAMSPENATYVGGFQVPSQVLGNRGRLVMALVTASGRSRQIVVDMEESLARSETSLDDVVSYNEFTDDPVHTLADSLEALVGQDATVGLELDFLSYDHHRRLRDRLPELRIRNIKDFLANARIIKSPDEVAALRAMGRAAHEMHYEALAATAEGDTELEIASRIVVGLFERGADDVKQLVVGSGDRSWHANPAPTARRLEQGDMIRLDIFASKGGYLSDCARTAVVGEPNGEQREIWHKFVELRQRTLDSIKPGASTRTIYFEYAAGLEAFGYQPINFLGHGLGLTLHEEPYIDRYSDSTLEAGMVLAIEPYLMLPDRQWGFQLEDELLVTETGCERLTDVADDAELIVVEPR